METEESRVLLNHKKMAAIIKASGLTQEKFAEKIGISDSYLRSLKREDKNISVNLAYEISREAHCSIENLLSMVSD